MWGYKSCAALFVSTGKPAGGAQPPPSALPPQVEPLRKHRGSLRRLSLEVVIVMPDFEKMYLTMFRASEEAINLLIKAQQECEEMFISAPEPEIKVLETEKNRSAPQ